MDQQPQQHPAMVQWQARFDNAQRMATEPRRPDESPEAFNQRQQAAYKQLRRLQSVKPTGPGSSQGQMAQGAPPKQPASRPQGNEGLYGYIARMLRGG